MEWSDVISQLLAILLQATLTVLSGVAVTVAVYIGARVREYLAAQTNQTTANTLVFIVQQAVLFAERLDQSGEAKKAIASNFARQMAEKYGIVVDEAQIANLIESAVTLLHQGAFAGGQVVIGDIPPIPELSATTS